MTFQQFENIFFKIFSSENLSLLLLNFMTLPAEPNLETFKRSEKKLGTTLEKYGQAVESDQIPLQPRPRPLQPAH